MKFACAIISAVLLIHLQCGALCLADSFRSAAKQEQPCHKHSGDPSNQPQQPHDTNSRCGQGSIIESKIAIASKATLNVVTAVAPAVTYFVPAYETFLPLLHLENPAERHSPLTTSILRI